MELDDVVEDVVGDALSLPPQPATVAAVATIAKLATVIRATSMGIPLKALAGPDSAYEDTRTADPVGIAVRPGAGVEAELARPRRESR
jgi:hypothetical protein